MPQPHTKQEKATVQHRDRRQVTAKEAPVYTGTNIQAFYAAQDETAADSREYAAQRRQR